MDVNNIARLLKSSPKVALQILNGLPEKEFKEFWDSYAILFFQTVNKNNK